MEPNEIKGTYVQYILVWVVRSLLFCARLYIRDIDADEIGPLPMAW